MSGVKNAKPLTKLYKIKENNDLIREKNGISALEFMDGSAIIAGVKLMCLDKWAKPGVFTPAAFPEQLYYDALKGEGIIIEESESQPL